MSKKCKHCGLEIVSTTRGHLLCFICYTKYNREKSLRWQKENSRKERERHQKWREVNPFKYKEQEKEWRKTHLDILKKNAKKWRDANHNRFLEISRKSYRNNRERKIKASQIYQKNHPDKTRELRKKHSTKRARELGYIPLNSYFKKSEGHHIDINKVIYIPEKLHKMFPHNHNKPETMSSINKEAFKFLCGVY